MCKVLKNRLVFNRDLKNSMLDIESVGFEVLLLAVTPGLHVDCYY